MKRSLLFLAVLLFISLSTSAQKLPNIQEASLRAPAVIKVDGKATEWNNQFQAYNKATEIFYTLSNDNDKLYLTIQATDPDIVNKIISKGITLTINGTGKMKDQEGLAITFPFLNKADFPPFGPYIDDKTDPIAMNTQMTGKVKDIKITGVKGIKDTISIYNQEGIKTITLFNEEKALTYELAMPLKYLGLSANEQKPFTYNIKLNGLNPGGDAGAVSAAINTQRKSTSRGIATLYSRNTPNLQGNGSMHVYGDKGDKHDFSISRQVDVKDGTFTIMGQNADRIVNLIIPTDFWGEYTLAK